MRNQHNTKQILTALTFYFGLSFGLCHIQSTYAEETSEPLKAEKSLVELKILRHEYQTRYRRQTNADGDLTRDVLQYKGLIDVGAFFFEDRISIKLRAQTGSDFGGGWNNTNIGRKGTGDEIHFDVRHLYITYHLDQAHEISAGSLPIEYGLGSDFTYLDSDGYLMGYRAKALVFDKEVILTGAYLGSYDDPSVFDRGSDLIQLNYAQLLINHTINELIAVSLDYTHMESDDYLRGVVSFDVKKLQSFVDKINLEATKQLSGEQENLFALSLIKNFQGLIAGRDLSLRATYSYLSEDIDVPLGNIWEGHMGFIMVNIPRVYKNKHLDLGVFTRAFFDLENFDKYRWESGLRVRF